VAQPARTTRATGQPLSISSRNTCRRVFFVYRSKPFIVARVLCCLFVDLIWRNLLYIPVERGDLIQSLPRKLRERSAQAPPRQ
jgi:hypothetical protein